MIIHQPTNNQAIARSQVQTFEIPEMMLEAFIMLHIRTKFDGQTTPDVVFFMDFFNC